MIQMKTTCFKGMKITAGEEDEVEEEMIECEKCGELVELRF